VLLTVHAHKHGVKETELCCNMTVATA